MVAAGLEPGAPSQGVAAVSAADGTSVATSPDGSAAGVDPAGPVFTDADAAALEAGGLPTSSAGTVFAVAGLVALFALAFREARRATEARRVPVRVRRER
jgi:hypothetical protein